MGGAVLVLAVLLLVSDVLAENVHMSKVFILPIEPGMFNWTLQGKRDQFSYRPTLLNAPDLPPWINYVYSTRHQTGFLYGVPPQLDKSAGIELEIIGLNKESYETRRRVVPMNIEEKQDPARYEVQLKVHNLNVEDLFDTHRLSRLLDVFRSKLWPGSRDDLHVTMLASAVQLGARLPLRPSEGEGVVLRLGSGADFSPALRELQEEVKPLWKISSCPRDFKRTSVERFFREQGFALDWCSFRLMESEELQLHATVESSPAPPSPSPPRWQPGPGEARVWRAPPARAEVPQRSYAHEFVVTILVPMLVLLLLVLLLSLILCFHHDSLVDYASDEYFDSIFDIFEDYWRRKRGKGASPEIQMVQYATVRHPPAEQRPLRRAPSHTSTPERAPSSAMGANSLASRSLTGSPNSSLPRSTSPRAGSDNNSCYMRPNPPPYTGPCTNSTYPRGEF